MRSRLIMAGLFSLVLAAAPVGGAYAQDNTGSEVAACPDLGTPNVTVVSYTGRMMQSQAKTAFDIAREKSVRYGVKMPMRQGNNGHVIFRTVSDINLEPYPALGCISVKTINVAVNVDHNVEIASEHEAGTCVYNELFNLENELMQQDEALINSEVRLIQTAMREHFKKHNAYGPISGIDINQATLDKKNEINEMVEKMVNLINEKAEKARREADVPTFYDEILKDCSGGQ